MIWPSLHYMSVWYPENPNTQVKQACENFVRALPLMIPCPHCGWHLDEFIKINDKLSDEDYCNDNPDDFECMNPEKECAGAEGESCQSISDVCASKSNLISFFARAHNNVNMNVHPCRKLWSSQDVIDKYESTNICAHNIVWGQCQLNKVLPDNYCCDPDSKYFLLPDAGLGNPCKSSDGSECVRQPACYAEPTEDGTVPFGREFFTTDTVPAVDVKGCKNDDNGQLATCPPTKFKENLLGGVTGGGNGDWYWRP